MMWPICDIQGSLPSKIDKIQEYKFTTVEIDLVIIVPYMIQHSTTTIEFVYWLFTYNFGVFCIIFINLKYQSKIL